jgi:glycosyltransferase involved in cell wall biosynthesis
VTAAGAPPRVSVVIPTRDRPALLVRAVRSVLAQSMPDFEVIVADDGSPGGTDGPRAELDDPRIVWLDAERRGVAAARNAACRAARGQWLAFLDDDNRWTPRFLERQLATADAADAEVVAALGVDLAADGTRMPQPAPPSSDPLRAAAAGWFPFTSCVMVRRSALAAVGGFPEEFDHGEDVHVWTALALHARWGWTPEVLMERPQHRGPRLTDDWAEYRRAAAALDHRFGRAVLARAGLATALRWHWRYVGRFEFIGVVEDPDGSAAATRRRAWASLRRQLGALPRSAGSLIRPALVVLLGPVGYWRAWALYDHAHRSRSARLRSRGPS